jgi:hypothetical protein
MTSEQKAIITEMAEEEDRRLASWKRQQPSENGADYHGIALAAEKHRSRAEALRACLDAADKTPAVVGLTEEARKAVHDVYQTSEWHRNESEGPEADVLSRQIVDDLLKRDPREYVAVRREDFDYLWSGADNWYQQERWKKQSKAEEEDLQRLKAAIDATSKALEGK